MALRMPEKPFSTLSLWPIFLIVLTDVFGFTLVIPLLGIYAERLHATPVQATLLVSVFAACQMVSGPILGTLSDRMGRKPLLILSQFGTFLGFLIMARAESLFLLFVGRIIDGGTAGNLSLAQAYISDKTPPNKRAGAFAVIGIAFGIGFTFGPFVSGLLVKYGINVPMYAASVLSLVSVLTTWLLLPNELPPGAATQAPAGPGGKRLGVWQWGEYANYFRRPGLAGMLWQFFAFSIGMAVFYSGFGLYAERQFTWHGQALGVREVGYLFAYAGIIGVFMQGGLVGRLSKRYGEPLLVHIAFVMQAVGYVGLAFSPDIPSLLVVTTILSISNALLRPALSSLISRSSGAHEQGLVMGLTQSLHSLAAVVSPPLAGLFLTGRFVPGWALCSALAAVYGVSLVRRGSGHAVIQEMQRQQRS